MPYRAWLLIVAFGLILPAPLLQAQEQADQPDGQAQSQQSPAIYLPNPLLIEIIEDEAEAEARRRHEEESRQREIDDLEAQQGMNAATQAMNEATQSMKHAAWLSTALVGLGTVLLIATLWLTRQANRAAQKAVEVTEAIGISQMRAWLSFTEWRLDAAGSEGSVEGFYIVLSWKNTGSTPAVNVRAFTGPAGDPRLTDDNNIFSGSDETTSTVGPSMSFSTSFPITPEELFATQSVPVIIRCAVAYDTVFEGVHKRHTILTFRIRYIGRAPLAEIKQGRIAPANLAFEPIGSESDRMT